MSDPIEAVARALALRKSGTVGAWKFYVEDARAALAALPPAPSREAIADAIRAHHDTSTNPQDYLACADAILSLLGAPRHD